MVLLWFTIGALLAFGIARYNESNKLFWQLILAFVLGYAAAVMVDRTFGSERSNDDLVQVGPTQMPVIAPNSTFYSLADVMMAPTKVTALESVSQVYSLVENEVTIIPSKVYGRTRDQPLKTLTQPPEYG